ncbi:MAG: histidine--tRNA ligase [Candidatus Woesebacteria bacterium]|jgi:histidyl-tRNA synthetase
MTKQTKQSVQTLKGFRDFLPAEKRKRDYVIKKVIETFENFGFEPLETPTLEYASLLLGKYGEEADKLVYTFEDRGGRKIGLRYDQTVPTARVLAQYQNELPKYFRRYEIQNVFRADKPQKGRYREFTQCDIDIFGSSSPLADAEILACTYEAFKNVGFKNIKLKINDRQTLMATLKPFAIDRINVFSIIQSIDKLDKLKPQQVIEELVKKGLTENSAKQVLTTVDKAQMSDNLRQIIESAVNLGVKKEDLEFTPSLARGLDYYTGMIFEVILPDYPVGSCGGGGRYDNLINELGGVDMPATGIAFGFDRMVEAAEKLDLIPADTNAVQALITIFDEKSQAASLKLANQLRQAGINTEVYPALDKLSKQFKLADKKNIPWVVIIGEEEAEKDLLSLKNMTSGKQKQLSVEEAIEMMKDK